MLRLWAVARTRAVARTLCVVPRSQEAEAQRQRDAHAKEREPVDVVSKGADGALSSDDEEDYHDYVIPAVPCESDDDDDYSDRNALATIAEDRDEGEATGGSARRNGGHSSKRRRIGGQ